MRSLLSHNIDIAPSLDDQEYSIRREVLTGRFAVERRHIRRTAASGIVGWSRSVSAQMEGLMSMATVMKRAGRSGAKQRRGGKGQENTLHLELIVVSFT